MLKTPVDYKKEALIVRDSSFPQAEKDLHYKELLMHLRRQNGFYFERDPEYIHVYNMIASLIEDL